MRPTYHYTTPAPAPPREADEDDDEPTRVRRPSRLDEIVLSGDEPFLAFAPTEPL